MLNELKQMFISAYHRYTGIDIELHSTRFKEELLSRIPGLQAHKRENQIVLTSDDAATEAILAVLSHSGNQNGLHSVQAEKFLPQYLFDGDASFSGDVGKDCQADSVPKSLLVLVQMILESKSLFLAADNETKNIALQLSHLINFNALKKQLDQKVTNVCYRSSQISALPVYTGLLLRSRTQKNGIIDKVSALGYFIL